MSLCTTHVVLVKKWAQAGAIEEVVGDMDCSTRDSK